MTLDSYINKVNTATTLVAVNALSWQAATDKDIRGTAFIQLVKVVAARKKVLLDNKETYIYVSKNK